VCDKVCLAAANVKQTSHTAVICCVFQVNYRSMARPPSDSGRNYAYRGIDVDAFFNSSCPSGAEAVAWSSLVDSVRQVVLQFVRSGTVSSWETFPDASYDISADISNATTPRYRSQKCNYWREHGFFPAYAWMN